jgi:hypothetical protein
MENKIFKIGFVLIALGLAVYVVFFTANDFQNNPDKFKELKLRELHNPLGTREIKFIDEFNLAQFLEKNGQLKEALKHYKNVYYNYPDVPKGEINLQAIHSINRLGKEIAEKQKLQMSLSDTEQLLKNYSPDLIK